MDLLGLFVNHPGET